MLYPMVNLVYFVSVNTQTHIHTNQIHANSFELSISCVAPFSLKFLAVFEIVTQSQSGVHSLNLAL